MIRLRIDRQSPPQESWAEVQTFANQKVKLHYRWLWLIPRYDVADEPRSQTLLGECIRTARGMQEQDDKSVYRVVQILEGEERILWQKGKWYRCLI